MTTLTNEKYCISITDEERYPYGPYDSEREAVLAAVELGKKKYGDDYDSFLIGVTQSSKDMALSVLDQISEGFFENLEEFLTDHAGTEGEFAYFNDEDKTAFKIFLENLLNADRYNYKGVIQSSKRIKFSDVDSTGNYSTFEIN